MNSAQPEPAPETARGTTPESARVLVVGRSPSVLLAAVQMLRDKGYRADVSNQFDRVLDDYDVTDLDILVFGGMIPPDTKQHLSEEATRRNSGITLVQGLAGIPGVIAAQVEAAAQGGDAPATGQVTYDDTDRTLKVVLDAPRHVSVEALWGTSFTPPEPTSASARIFEGELGPGAHAIALPAEVPDVASFAAIAIGSHMRVLTIGPMPQSVLRMRPKSAEDRRLPDVTAVSTQSRNDR